MKAEIMDLNKIKLIAENSAEAIIMSKWVGNFKYIQGSTNIDRVELIYKIEEKIMKKPENFKELFKLVNPQDLLDVIDFSGINDHHNKEHSKIRRELQDKVYHSLNYNDDYFDDSKEVHYWRKEPRNLNTKMEDIHYEIIVESLQDFYWWSHEFHHVHAHIFQRVQHALEIPLEEISIIMERGEKEE